MFIKEIYTQIYKSNYWNSKESVSGGGSEIASTEVIRQRLPELFDKWNIKSVLDLPCGDFNWMRLVDMSLLDSYIGADIVDDLIVNCNKKYKNEKISFQVLDIMEDKLPKVDLIIVKDLFIHFSINDIHKSLKNLKASGSKYLLTTNGIDGVFKNDEIKTGGGYRGINLYMHPFDLPSCIDDIDYKVHKGHLTMWELDKI